jgi:hypothetical protein
MIVLCFWFLVCRLSVWSMVACLELLDLSLFYHCGMQFTLLVNNYLPCRLLKKIEKKNIICHVSFLSAILFFFFFFFSYFFYQKMLIHNYDHSSFLVLRVILMHGLSGPCRIHLSRLLDKQVMRSHLCL